MRDEGDKVEGGEAALVGRVGEYLINRECARNAHFYFRIRFVNIEYLT